MDETVRTNLGVLLLAGVLAVVGAVLAAAGAEVGPIALLGAAVVALLALYRIGVHLMRGDRSDAPRPR